MKEDIKQDVGVIVGRFQLHEFHPAHRKMVEEVQKNHKKVLLFLGTVRKSPTTKNPLDFVTRKEMVLSAYPSLTVLPLPDQRDDHQWSLELDKRIIEACPANTIVIYGGRDSFIPSYSGSFPTEELEEVLGHSATQVRKEVSLEVRNSNDFRAGIIYSVYNQYPKVYTTVDVAPMKGNLVLLGRKPTENKFRFIGGFSDPIDNSFEEAAEREAFEESGVKLTNLRYVSSQKINDWRYRGERDQIISNFYIGEAQNDPVAGDDICQVEWFDLNQLSEKDLMDEHHILLKNLKKFLQK